MLRPLFLSSVFLLSACAPKHLTHTPPASQRTLASMSADKLLREEGEAFSGKIQEKLQALHSYYVIGLKNLKEFDEKIATSSLEQLYTSDEYLRLIAVRTQAEEIEDDLIETWEQLQSMKSIKAKTKNEDFKKKLQSFAQQGDIKAGSLENLLAKIHFSLPVSKIKGPKGLSKMNISQEYAQLSNSKEFQIYESNIEHISHLLEIEVRENNKVFYPSSTKAGNITGLEFPEKVWSLTFDDGPGKATTLTILKNLKEKNLKATFFQLNKMVKVNPSVARELDSAGMEMASHSYTHLQLTKVDDSAVLNKEIATAKNDLKKFYGKEIKFFRLPYGAGVNTPHIRKLIADQGMIHVFWSVDTLDWMVSQTTRDLENRVLDLMKKSRKDAGVLLFHDIHQRTAEATVKIMDHLKKDNRRVCTLEEIVTQMNEDLPVCPK